MFLISSHPHKKPSVPLPSVPLHHVFYISTNSQQTFACVSLRYRTLHPPQNLCRPLKTFACVSLRYTKRCGGGGVDGNTGSGL